MRMGATAAAAAAGIDLAGAFGDAAGPGSFVGMGREYADLPAGFTPAGRTRRSGLVTHARAQMLKTVSALFTYKFVNRHNDSFSGYLTSIKLDAL